MTVDPRVATWIGLISCIAVVFGTAANWTGWVPDDVAVYIVGASNLTAKTGLAVMTYCASVASSSRGPVAMKMGWH